jgi:hypothetical protein
VDLQEIPPSLPAPPTVSNYLPTGHGGCPLTMAVPHLLDNRPPRFGRARHQQISTDTLLPHLLPQPFPVASAFLGQVTLLTPLNGTNVPIIPASPNAC